MWSTCTDNTGSVVLTVAVVLIWIIHCSRILPDYIGVYMYALLKPIRDQNALTSCLLLNHDHNLQTLFLFDTNVSVSWITNIFQFEVFNCNITLKLLLLLLLLYTHAYVLPVLSLFGYSDFGSYKKLSSKEYSERDYEYCHNVFCF